MEILGLLVQLRPARIEKRQVFNYFMKLNGTDMNDDLMGKNFSKREKKNCLRKQSKQGAI